MVNENRTNHYIFDLDGTLTPPRSKMLQEMKESLFRFMKEKTTNSKFHLISGSDIDKIKEQTDLWLLNQFNSVHACSGNEVWMNGEIIRTSHWKPSPPLLIALKRLVDMSRYENKKTNHIEKRVGSINFSICGRDSNTKERFNYFNWDIENKERKGLVEILSEMFPDIEFDIGGQISIDIYPKGKNKSQIIDTMSFKEPDDYIYFFGDSIIFGNDKSLADRIKQHSLGVSFNVSDWEDTVRILSTM